MGKLLRKARRNHGDTAKELAKKLGCTAITISHWENGKTTPVISYWKSLAEYLGITVQRLAEILDKE